MNTTISVATMFALTIAASPLAAQIGPRTGDSRTGRTSRDRIETVEDAIEAARTRGSIYGDARTSGQSRVPKGHLPPRGMCRVWIDGVPPGHQPEPTSCAQAEQDRFRYSNARVIYGDRESFPGKGKGKWDRERDDDDVLRDGGILRDGRILVPMTTRTVTAGAARASRSPPSLVASPTKVVAGRNSGIRTYPNQSEQILENPKLLSPGPVGGALITDM